MSARGAARQKSGPVAARDAWPRLFEPEYAPGPSRSWVSRTVEREIPDYPPLLTAAELYWLGPVERAFWSRVALGGKSPFLPPGIEVSGQCWVWTGTVVPSGYAKAWLPEGVGAVWVHRWTFTTYVEEIVDGNVIDHECERKRCVRPDHLSQCTDAENLRRWRERRLRFVIPGQTTFPLPENG